jgi:hypothetical protein
MPPGVATSGGMLPLRWAGTCAAGGSLPEPGHLPEPQRRTSDGLTVWWCLGRWRRGALALFPSIDASLGEFRGGFNVRHGAGCYDVTVNRHCWLAPVWQGHRMSAAPLTSRHFPLCTARSWKTPAGRVARRCPATRQLGRQVASNLGSSRGCTANRGAPLVLRPRFAQWGFDAVEPAVVSDLLAAHGLSAATVIAMTPAGAALRLGWPHLAHDTR